jgi:hypothetical protein
LTRLSSLSCRSWWRWKSEVSSSTWRISKNSRRVRRAARRAHRRDLSRGGRGVQHRQAPSRSARCSSRRSRSTRRWASAPPKKTRTGQWATDAKVLESFGEHPLIAKLLNHRQLTKLKGTYVDALPKLVRESTGRVHTSFNQAVAATGRLSSDNPNLQNIPIRTEEGRRIRKAFVPGKRGWRLISADYSQVRAADFGSSLRGREPDRGFPRGRGRAHADCSAGVRSDARDRWAGAALACQGDQLRLDLWHGPAAPGWRDRHESRRSKEVHRGVFRSDAPGQGMDRQEPGGCADRGGDAHPLGSTPPDPRDQRRRAEIAGQRGEHRAE